MAKSIDQWRNPIVTLLIERPMTRREIHRALHPRVDPKKEAQIDNCLIAMVRSGDLVRPRKGHYEIAKRV